MNKNGIEYKMYNTVWFNKRKYSFKIICLSQQIENETICKLITLLEVLIFLEQQQYHDCNLHFGDFYQNRAMG